jgi:cell division protein FtsB
MAEDQDPTDVDDEGTEDKGKPDGEDALGDAGKKALDAMKAARAAARKERDAAKAEAEQLRAELAKLKGGDDKKPPEIDEKAIRESAKKDAEKAVMKDRALDRVEARAGKLFADPEDARALLASKVAEFLDDNTIDNEAIDAALAELLKKKPHLGAQSGKRFEGGADGGKGGQSPSGVKQITQSELDKMTPQQIVDAQAKGQLDKLMGLT